MAPRPLAESRRSSPVYKRIAPTARLSGLIALCVARRHGAPSQKNVSGAPAEHSGETGDGRAERLRSPSADMSATKARKGTPTGAPSVSMA